MRYFESIDRGLNGSKTSHCKYEENSYQSKTRDVSRGGLSHRIAIQVRNSTAIPTARSFRNSSEIDPVTKMRARQEDNWTKIIDFNQRMHNANLQEALKKKKDLQCQMRTALMEQLELKKKNKNFELQNDVSWMKGNIEKVNKEISDEERKNQMLR